jgi:effector-binding domain-containing protein
MLFERKRRQTANSTGFWLILAGILTLAAPLTSLSGPAFAEAPQQASPPTTSETKTPPPAQPQSATPAAPPAASSTAPHSPAANEADKAAPGVAGDAVTETLEVPARPVAVLRGSAKWEEGFSAITNALTKINKEVEKAELKPAGHPIAVFVQTDDNGFNYEAMVPLAEKPNGKDQLSDEIKLGMSPAGKAIKFQHRGAYDDIDSTYDLITAFLDEKGLEAQNMFIEEYLTDTKGSDDQNLQVDIYVLIK